jgi:hypothetical protein
MIPCSIILDYLYLHWGLVRLFLITDFKGPDIFYNPRLERNEVLVLWLFVRVFYNNINGFFDVGLAEVSVHQTDGKLKPAFSRLIFLSKLMFLKTCGGLKLLGRIWREESDEVWVDSVAQIKDTAEHSAAAQARDFIIRYCKANSLSFVRSETRM